MASSAVQTRKNVTTGSKALISAPINTTLKKSSPSNNTLVPVKDSAGKVSGRKKKRLRQNRRGYGPRKEAGKEKTETANVETTTAAGTSLAATGSRESKKRAKRERRAQEELAGSAEEAPENWKLSPSLGGRFLMLDPVFARNEKYILLAHAMSLKIYSTKTSLLVRNIPIPSKKSSERIVSYLPDPQNDSRVYIATLSSHLSLWDWVEGKLIQKWNLGLSPLRFISSCADEKPEAEFVGTIYAATSANKGGALWRIKLPKVSKGPIEKSSIYESPIDLLSATQVLDSGNIVVLIAGRILAIGNKHSEEEGKTEWGVFRKYPMNFQLTCMDTYLPVEEGSKGKSRKGKKGKSADSLGDVVVGDDTGAMHVFHNALRVKEDPKPEPVIRMLHWHRRKVRSVKWALDGNYIISGGSETVLVMWQIETGHKQFLPHLGSVIEHIVVSPRATSYAILLSDNSVMILSTTELKPKTNIAGIQSRVFPPRETKQVKVPCVLHPTTASRLLVATPSSQLGGNTSSPYLQTFDTYSDRHVARQALTRTNATIFNSGPEKDMILEPNVSQIAITVDGEWLATIDEWRPPRRKTDVSGSEDSPIIEEEGHGREVYLRFWKWGEKKKLWELVTRVDSPHPAVSSPGAEEVFDLIPSPKGHGFATIGADGSVRIWRARTRTRAGGAQVRNAEGALTSWGCRRVIVFSRGKKEIELSTLILLDALPKKSKSTYWGQLAFSEDGSVVAIATPVLGLGSNKEDSTVHLADSDTAVVRQSVGGLQLGRIHGLGILERYLIILGSSKLLVWDLANSSVQWEFSLESLGASSEIGGHLAVDHHSQTFAVALSPKKPSSDKQRVFVFDTSSVAPVHVQQVSPVQITALKSSEGGKGYMVLDAEAKIQYISPILAPHVSAAHQASSAEFSLEGDGEAGEDVSVGLSGVYLTNGATSDNDDEPEAMDESDEDDGDVVDHVIPREALEGIFDAVPSYTAGSVEEAFEKVLVLFAKKPLSLDDDNDLSEGEEDDDMDMQIVTV